MGEQRVAICRLDELADPGAREFELPEEDGTEYGFVVRQGDHIRAYINSCPHTGAALNWAPDRFLTKSGDRIMCGVHGAIFRIEDGHCLQGPCEGRDLHPLAVEIEEDTIFIRPGTSP